MKKTKVHHELFEKRWVVLVPRTQLIQLFSCYSQLSLKSVKRLIHAVTYLSGALRRLDLTIPPTPPIKIVFNILIIFFLSQDLLEILNTDYIRSSAGLLYLYSWKKTGISLKYQNYLLKVLRTFV